jgi:bifunctional DNA-binding transcriptional regulator/antitoxin component of YhaV-PrlF toxin-antitoxin module
MPQPASALATLQLRDRGVLTLPKALRERYQLEAGSALQLVDLGGVFALTPLVPLVPAIAAELGQTLRDEGLSADELLEGLRAERERYARENYGPQGALTESEDVL